jgi:hypothetical protein
MFLAHSKLSGPHKITGLYSLSLECIIYIVGGLGLTRPSVSLWTLL